MFKNPGKIIIKYRWIIIIFWISLAVIIYLNSPALSQVAKNNQENFLESSAESIRASNLINKLYPSIGNGADLIITISRNGKLTSSDEAYAKSLGNYLLSNKDKLHIESIMSPFQDVNLKDQMISKNDRAAMITVELTVPSTNDLSIESIKNIREVITSSSNKYPGIINRSGGLKLNVTGDAAFLSDEHDIVNQSMDLTTKITVILVLIVLIFIYRSPVAPVLPLATIGLSFIISSGIIASITKYGFKVSSYTEMFMIAVLFGAGTDYCLLLISRFKEELASGKSLPEALDASLPSAGRSIISSGGTVLIGFLFMGLAKFGLFNTTGPSVAIGVAIALLMVITLVPAFIAVIGKKIFWPFHTDERISKSTATSKLWGRIARTVTSRPGVFVIIITIALLPLAFLNTQITRSFDQISELPKYSDSVKGFQVIRKNFNQGDMLPLNVVIKSNKSMWDSASLSAVESIASRISLVNNVVKVRTATRPLGSVLTEASMNSQINLLSKGIKDISNGIPPMINGLDKMQSGTLTASKGLSDGSRNTRTLSDSTLQIKNGVIGINSGLLKLKDGQNLAINGFQKIYSGLDGVQAGISSSQAGALQLGDALNNAQKNMDNLLTKYPQLATDINFQTTYGTIKNSSSSLVSMSQGLIDIGNGVKANQNGLKTASDSLKQISSGIASSSAALHKVQSGLEQTQAGQQKLSDGLNTASYNLGRLGNGFSPIKSGLLKMGKGLNTIDNFAKNYSKNAVSVFYLPREALKEYPKLKDAMDYYISPNGRGITMEVVLSTPPYTNNSLDKVNEIKSAISEAMKGTALSGSEFYIGGPTSVFNDVRSTTASDFIKVMVLVLLGIFVVLAILLRSLIAPIYLLFTMILSYASTMGISYLVFQRMLGYEGLNWAVPFFTFCVLVALGIDYNIFLMARVKEEYVPGDTRGSVERAVSTTGQIITSCGIIMAGTFGAIMAASIKSMSEVGFATVVGLLLDTFIIRCLLVPGIAVKIGELNWWPWGSRKK